MQLCEKYRPRNWADFIGQSKTVSRVRALLARLGFGEGAGDCLWIAGPSGTGKTTLAHLVAGELGADDFWACLELEGKHVNAQTVRELGEWLHLMPPFGAWKVVIINEGQSIRDGAVEAFLGLLEHLPAHRLVIFTSTIAVGENLFGEFTGPISSRCKPLTFTNQGLAQLFAARAKAIADAEGLNGQSEQQYLRLVQDCHNNMRAVLQRIDAGELVGPETK